MKKRLIRNLIYCAVLTLILTGVGLADNSLEVKCVDENGQIIQKGKVYAFALKNNDRDDEKINKQGIAFFKKLKDDYYRVWVEADDYQKKLIEFVPLFDDTQESIEITLKPGDKDAPLYFEDNLIRQRVDTLFQAGTEALQQQNIEEAEKRLSECVELYPSHMPANNNLAFIYFNTGRIEEAKECYERVINIAQAFKYIDDNPENIAAYEQQIAQTQELLKTMPLQIIASEVDQAMNAGDFETAVEKLDEMIELQPENAAAYFQKAIALTRISRLDEAAASVNKAIELDPSQEAFQDLAKRIGDMQAAQATNKIRDSLLEIDKLNSSGDYEEALSRLQKMESDIPKELLGAYWWINGRAHRGLNQKEETISAYRKALEKETDSQNLGIYLDELQNWLMDMEYTEELLDVYPEVAPLASVDVSNGLSAIAGAFIRKGDQESARATFEKILEIDPDNAEAYYELGMNYFYEVKDEARARELLEKYIEIGEDDGHLNNAKNVIAVMESEN